MARSPFSEPRGIRSAESPAPIPAAGVMLHLLGAVALGWGVVVWAVLVALGTITASVFGVAVASAALTGAAAWSVWLVRATEGREHDDHGPDSGCACSAPPLIGGGAVNPEEHFHSN